MSPTRRPWTTSDRQIITALQSDGRRAFTQIAEDLGIPASSVRYRTRRLEELGILQVVGIANPLAIGFDRLAMIGIRTAPGQGACRVQRARRNCRRRAT